MLRHIPLHAGAGIGGKGVHSHHRERQVARECAHASAVVHLRSLLSRNDALQLYGHQPRQVRHQYVLHHHALHTHLGRIAADVPVWRI